MEHHIAPVHFLWKQGRIFIGFVQHHSLALPVDQVGRCRQADPVIIAKTATEACIEHVEFSVHTGDARIFGTAGFLRNVICEDGVSQSLKMDPVTADRIPQAVDVFALLAIRGDISRPVDEMHQIVVVYGCCVNPAAASQGFFGMGSSIGLSVSRCSCIKIPASRYGAVAS